MSKPANMLIGNPLACLDGGLHFCFRIRASRQKGLQPLVEALWTLEGFVTPEGLSLGYTSL